MKSERCLVWGLGIYAVATLISMATMSVGAGIVALAILIAFGGPVGFWHEFRREISRPNSRNYLIVSLALAGACALSLIVAAVFPLTYGGKHAEIHFLRDMAKCWYLFWPLVLVVGLRQISIADQNRVLNAWLVAFAVLSIVGVQQYFTGWPRPQRIPGHDAYFHATLFLGHHLSVASIFIFPLFVALDLTLRPRGQSRRFLIAASGLGVLTLFLGFSRMLWVALPIGLLLWGFWALPRRWGISLAVLACIGGLAISQHPEIQRRIHDTQGVGTREQLWATNIEFLKARPISGTGWHHNLETAEYYLRTKQPQGDLFIGHAHNNALEMLASTGVIGFLAWFTWCVFAVWLLWKNPRLGFSRGLICAWLVFQLNGLTQVNFWEAKVLHQVMWVVAWSLL